MSMCVSVCSTYLWNIVPGCINAHRENGYETEITLMNYTQSTVSTICVHVFVHYGELGETVLFP